MSTPFFGAIVVRQRKIAGAPKPLNHEQLLKAENIHPDYSQAYSQPQVALEMLESVSKPRFGISACAGIPCPR
jgi:hypothetical protein